MGFDYFYTSDSPQTWIIKAQAPCVPTRRWRSVDLVGHTRIYTDPPTHHYHHHPSTPSEDYSPSSLIPDSHPWDLSVTKAKFGVQTVNDRREGTGLMNWKDTELKNRDFTPIYQHRHPVDSYTVHKSYHGPYLIPDLLTVEVDSRSTFEWPSSTF